MVIRSERSRQRYLRPATVLRAGGRLRTVCRKRRLDTMFDATFWQSTLCLQWVRREGLVLWPACAGVHLFVGHNEQGCVFQVPVLQRPSKFGLGFFDSCPVAGVHDKYQSSRLCIVHLPHGPNDFLSAHIAQFHAYILVFYCFKIVTHSGNSRYRIPRYQFVQNCGLP